MQTTNGSCRHRLIARYTRNTTFLREESFPLLRGVAEWWRCWLKKTPPGNGTAHGTFTYDDFPDCTREYVAITGGVTQRACHSARPPEFSGRLSSFGGFVKLSHVSHPRHAPWWVRVRCRLKQQQQTHKNPRHATPRGGCGCGAGSSTRTRLVRRHRSNHDVSPLAANQCNDGPCLCATPQYHVKKGVL